MTKLLIIITLFMSNSVFSFDFERLFLPGKVINGHKKLEQDCKNCHRRGRETNQKALCLTCHKKVASDLKLKQGFHSKNKTAFSSDCVTCHTDHKGRAANIVLLNKDQFNHDETDYKLKNKHKLVACSNCHKKQSLYREAPKRCVSCHEKQDIHNTKLGKNCQQCHNTKSWRSDSFDHNKTKFKLKFAHQKVPCQLCHINNQFKNTTNQCVNCHAIKDVHNKKLGSKCSSCHNEKKWDKPHFDHNKDTRYKILGAHKQVDCLACHKKTISFTKNLRLSKPRLCISCHKNNDIHEGKNGTNCSQCHNEKNWLKTEFDHNKKTQFALKGAHKKASCQACHQNDIKGEKTPSQCISCHAEQDVHETQLGKKCHRCHNDNSWWLDDVRFDHDLSDFPLLGQHATIGCESCHFSSAFKNAKKQCINCHSQDDVHESSLGKECSQCHNSNAWLIWNFDHSKTEFNIEGAHESLSCSACHNTPLDNKHSLTSQCIDCHLSDDIHDGNFGSQCKNCHSQENFSNINLQSFSTFKQLRTKQ